MRIVTDDISYHDARCVVGEYIMEYVILQIYVTHENKNHVMCTSMLRGKWKFAKRHQCLQSYCRQTISGDQN